MSAADGPDRHAVTSIFMAAASMWLSAVTAVPSDATYPNILGWPLCRLNCEITSRTVSSSRPKSVPAAGSG